MSDPDHHRPISLHGRSWTWSLGLALAVFAGGWTIWLWAHDPASEHPRQRLFASRGGDPVLEHLEVPARLSVLFFPEVEGCAPQQVEAVRALRRVEEGWRDTRIFSVLPASRKDLRELYQEELPGTILPVSDTVASREQATAPRPRLEVWAGQRLLLLRSLPTKATEEEIYEEVLWTRSFTEPLREPGG